MASNEKPLPGAPATEFSLHDVYLLVVFGDLDEMRKALSVVPRATLERIVLNAAIAQNEARMDRSRVLYERALCIAADSALPYVLDLAAPLLIMGGDYDRYEEIRDRCVFMPAFAGLRASLDAMSAARRGESIESACAEQEAIALSGALETELLAGRLLARCAYAALHRREFAHAADLAKRSARTLEALSAHRPAAMAHSIAYNAHHAGTGDIAQAEIHAATIVAAARRAGDTSLENLGLVAQYEMACECADVDFARTCRQRIDALAIAEQYEERFARGLGDVILAGLTNDGATFYANAVLLRDALAPDRPAMALAAALRSLGAAGVGDFAEARRFSRNALGLAALRDVAEPAYATRYRQLARTLASATCVLIGDTTRGQRAVLRIAANDAHNFLALAQIAHGADAIELPRRLRGYAQLISRVAQAVRNSYRHSKLSAAEYLVLQLLAQGLTAPQIAEHTGRSVYTIRAHTRSIIAKFDVHGRAAAIAFAHRNGYLQQR